MERQEAINKLKQIKDKDLHELAKQYDITVFSSSGKVNKGWAGHVCERYLGLPINSSQSPNFGSWELKVIPFEQSHLLAKLKKAVILARIVGKNYSEPTFIHSVTGIDLKGELYDAVRDDYELIRECIKNDGFSSLTGHMGKYIQPRTKGQGGKAPKTRAFYARPIFLSQFINL